MIKRLMIVATVAALCANLEAQSIYTKKSNDAWNQIFHSLFSRRLARLSSDFPQGAPFTPSSGGRSPVAKPLGAIDQFGNVSAGPSHHSPKIRDVVFSAILILLTLWLQKKTTTKTISTTH
jgi:hypothetical protein